MVTPLEWRRHFYDRTDGAALAAAVLAGVLAAATLAGAVFNINFSTTHPSVILAWAGLFTVCCGGALTYVTRSGVIPPRRGPVNVADGITHVRAGSDWFPLTTAGITVAGIIVLAIAVITADAVGAIHISDQRQYPAIVMGTAALIIYSVWTLAKKPIGRRLEFSPHGFTSQANFSEVLVPWDSILEVNVHRGPSALRRGRGHASQRHPGSRFTPRDPPTARTRRGHDPVRRSTAGYPPGDVPLPGLAAVGTEDPRSARTRHRRRTRR